MTALGSAGLGLLCAFFFVSFDAFIVAPLSLQTLSLPARRRCAAERLFDMSPEKRHFPVPTEVPGRRITDPGHRNFLRRHLATICGLENWKCVLSGLVGQSQEMCLTREQVPGRSAGQLQHRLDASARNYRVRRAPTTSLLTADRDFGADGSFWVCEKSDGIRVLVLVVTNKSDPKRPRQEIFFVRVHLSPPSFPPHTVCVLD